MILFTRRLNLQQLELAKQLNLEVEAIPFITTTPIYNSTELAQKVNAYSADAWIFTSANAARLAVDIEPKPKLIYTVGARTAAPLSNFNPISTAEASGTALAEYILSAEAQNSYLHWCGNLSQPLFSSAAYHMLEVYQTELLPQPIRPNAYQYIVFYSPSAVDAFFQANKKTTAQLVCIGDTTADHLRTYGYDSITPEQQTTEALLHLLAK